MTITTIKDLIALGGYDDPAALVSHLSAHGTLAHPEDRANVDMRALNADAERLMGPSVFAAEFGESSETLADFLSKTCTTYLWINRVIGGATDFNENTEAEGEDYCPEIEEVAAGMDLLDLEGKVASGRWEWNGGGEPRDCNGTSIVHVVAGLKSV